MIVDQGWWTARRSSVRWLTLALVALLATACQRTPSSRETGPSTVARPDADALLQRVLATYREARTYRDNATISLSYVDGGQRFSDQAEIAVVLARPNRLRVRAYQVEIACDGGELQAAIRDPATNHLDGQVLTRPAPKKLALTDLLSDPLLNDQLGNGLLDPEVGRHPLQLELLLADQGIPWLSGREVRRRLGADETLDGHPCYRLELETPRGQFTLLVDQKLAVVRRVEYPREALIPSMAQSADVTDVRLVADFSLARIDEPVRDEEFVWAPPANSRSVRFFVPPPQPLPSQLFGREAGNFRLSQLSGPPITKESLAGKIAVLIWFRDHPACETALQQLQEVHQKLHDDDVRFFAVSTEPSTVSDDQVAAVARRWKVDVPLARDRLAHGRDLFQIAGAPTLVVLDQRSRVQIIEVGANPNLKQELPGVLDRLRRGDDLATEILAQHQREVDAYQRQLAIASGASTGQVIELAETPIAPASKPKRLRLAAGWTNLEIKSPGNILVIGDSERSAASVSKTPTKGAASPVSTAGEAPAPLRILVHEGGRTIAELDTAGQIVDRHELPLPERAAVSVLRACLDRDGRRHYVVSGLLAAQCFVLDEQWNVVTAYPPPDLKHDGIRDVQIADVDGDGRPEVGVAFWGLPGIHLISLEGKVLWTNRRLVPAVSLALGPPRPAGTRELLASGDQGTVLRLDSIGQSAAPTDIPGWTVLQLFAARFSEPANAAFAALGENRKGQPALVVLDDSLREQWSYPLPPGTSRLPVERVNSGYFLAETSGTWAIGGVDGSIHLVAGDGASSDYFQTGKPVQGLAVYRAAGRGVLLVASPDGVSAWHTE